VQENKEYEINRDYFRSQAEGLRGLKFEDKNCPLTLDEFEFRQKLLDKKILTQVSFLQKNSFCTIKMLSKYNADFARAIQIYHDYKQDLLTEEAQRQQQQQRQEIQHQYQDYHARAAPKNEIVDARWAKQVAQ